MRFIIIFAVAIAIASAGQLFRGRPDRDEGWKNFKERHGKQYKNGPEEARRRKNWEESRDIIEKHNQEADSGKHSYKMAENHISDMDPEERQDLARTKIPDHAHKERAFAAELNYAEDRQTPASVDWRTDSCMPAVKNQRSCGSCWAFAGNTPVEFLRCKKNGFLETLSEQQLVDCTRAAGNYGCNGGFYVTSWNYAKSPVGQTCSSKYPYTATNGTCLYTSSMAVGFTTGSSYIANTETALRTAVAKSPVAGVLQVISSFYSYSSGVYSDSACPKDGQTVNHAVVIAGYGTDSFGKQYWIIRNSWGPYWGQQGYILVERGVNMCNIESQWNAVPTV